MQKKELYMKNKPLLAIGVLALSLMIASCGSDSQRPADAPSALIVDVTIVEPQRFEQSIEVTGNILPFEQVELKAPVSGTVLEINFEEGQHVQKGAALIRIDDRAWQAEAKGLRAQVLNAKSSFERQKALLDIEGASQAEVDAARSTLADLESRLEQLEVNIRLANVQAPFSGVVGMRDFSLGTFLQQGSSITQLAQVEKLKLNFELPSKYASFAKAGKRIELIAGRDTGEAVIYALNPSISNSSRTLQVRATINNNTKFTPGDFAQVRFAMETDSNAILIPTDAVIPELNAQTVFVIEDGKAHKKTVILGGRNAQNVQILSGLSAGDKVIVSGLLVVKEGMEVNYKLLSAE